MALTLTLPDTLKPFLLRTEAKGVYGIDDWTAWLNRRFAKIGTVRVTVADDSSQQFSTKIMGIVKGKNGPSLIVDNFVPEPDPSFFDQPKPLNMRLMYVEWGFEVVTKFKAVATRPVTVKGSPAIELVDVSDLNVSLGIHITSVSPKSGIEMGLFIRGAFTEVRPSRISLNRIWFTGKLPDDIGEEGLIVEKASVKLGPDEPDTMLKLQAFPERTGGYLGQLLEMEHISRLANFIEQHWTNQASRLAKDSQKMDLAGARKAGQVPPSERKVEDYLKPHYFLLGDDESWIERLNRFGVCVPVASKVSDEVIAKFEESRCDVIIGDADYWDTDALEIAQVLRGHEKYSKVPFLWISGPENIFAEAGGQDLIDFGAYDFLDRNLPEEELKERFHWANAKTLEIGNGPSLAIVSQEERQQYRLGIQLRSPEIKIVKVIAPENTIVSRLVEADARWILVDSIEFGEDAQKIIHLCMEWANRGQDKREVFLVQRGASAEQVMEWKKNGIHDVIAYDPSLLEIRKVILEHIAADLAQK